MAYGSLPWLRNLGVCVSILSGLGNSDFRMRHFNTHLGTVRGLQFAQDGKSLYMLLMNPEQQSGRFHLARRIELTCGALIGEWHFEPCNWAILSPDERSIYYDCGCDYLTELRQIDLATRREVILLQDDILFVSRLAMTPNQHILALGGIESIGGESVHCVRRFDVLHRTLLDPILTIATCLEYAPNGLYLAVGGQLREEFRDGPSSGIRIWSGKKRLEEFPEPARHLAWSRDGRLAWGIDEQLNITRPCTQEPVRSWHSSPGELTALCFSPESRLLLTGTGTGVCALHNSIVGQVSAMFDWGIGLIHSIAFSPDGLTCAAGGEHGQVVVWDVDV